MNTKIKLLLVIILLIAAFGLFRFYFKNSITPIKTVVKTAQIKAPPFKFLDITKHAGINFKSENGATGNKLLPETMGTGVAAVDIDNDNDVDLIFVSATRWPWQDKQKQPPSISIFLNNGKGLFKKANFLGLSQSFYAVGISVGDVDNNGFKDLYITALGENHLYLNNGKDFIESAKKSGVNGGADDWSTGSSFFDYDNDGDLDLVYGNYVKWSQQRDLEVNYSLTGIGKAYGPPTDFAATSLKLFKNNGQGIFKDVSVESGIAENPQSTDFSNHLQGKSLVVQPLDIDNDGALDLFVANDTTRNFLFHNLGEGKFEEQGEILGVAYDSAGHATGAMGVDVAYFGKSSEQVIAVGNFANEMTSYFVRYPQQQNFSELSVVSGIGPGSRKRLTFGVLFVDLDNDGREDLFQVNGHVENDINRVQRSQKYLQSPQLFWNCGEKCKTRFVLSKAFSNQPLIARGVAYADFDKDGDDDLVITQVNGNAILFRNDTPHQSRWLRVKLNQSGGNGNAIGAVVTLNGINGEQKKKLVMPTRGYLSQSVSTLNFIIPNSEKKVVINVTWPNGTKTQHLVNNFNREIILNRNSTPE